MITFPKSVKASSLFTTAPCAVAMVMAIPRNIIIKTPKIPPKTKRLLYITFTNSSAFLHSPIDLKAQEDSSPIVVLVKLSSCWVSLFCVFWLYFYLSFSFPRKKDKKIKHGQATQIL